MKDLEEIRTNKEKEINENKKLKKKNLGRPNERNKGLNWRKRMKIIEERVKDIEEIRISVEKERNEKRNKWKKVNSEGQMKEKKKEVEEKEWKYEWRKSGRYRGNKNK